MDSNFEITSKIIFLSLIQSILLGSLSKNLLVTTILAFNTEQREIEKQMILWTQIVLLKISVTFILEEIIYIQRDFEVLNL